MAAAALCCYLFQSGDVRTGEGSETLAPALAFLAPVCCWQSQGPEERDQSACVEEPTQLKGYFWCGNGESRGQLGIDAEGQK